MKYIKSIYLLLTLCLFANKQIIAQKLTATEIEQFKKDEASLKIMVDSIRNSYMMDEKLDISYEFITKLKATLNQPNSFLYPFDSLRKLMHIIDAPDGNFRIFNWVVTTSSVKKTYFGAIQLSNHTLIPLLDYSDKLEETQNANQICSNKEWYGGEYYNILKDNLDGKPIYILFGFNSSESKINKKFVDVLSFENNQVRFGAPIFMAPDSYGKVQMRNRFIQYYKKGVSTTLNLDPALGAIVFNRLESEVSAPSRLDTYVPAGPIDGLKKNGAIWTYQPQILSILKLSDGKAPIDGVMN